jgi:hypothetical protein
MFFSNNIFELSKTESGLFAEQQIPDYCMFEDMIFILNFMATFYNFQEDEIP